MTLECQKNDGFMNHEFAEINRLADKGKLEHALKRCRALYAKFPEHPRVIHAIGLLSYRTGDLEIGEKFIRDAIHLQPDYVDAYYNLGRLLQLEMRLDEANAVFNKAITLSPHGIKQLVGLAHVLINQERHRESLKVSEQVLDLDESIAEIYSHRGTCFFHLGLAATAVDNYLKSIKLNPYNSDAHSNLLFALQVLPGVSPFDIYREAVAWGRKFATPLTKRSRLYFNSPFPNRKLRIGYVSGDFKNHPVSYHLLPVLRAHDKDQFEVYLYSNCNAADQTTEALVNVAHCYRLIAAFPDDKAEAIIRRDGIDILIDLAGHTGLSRLRLFARRPAPVQVSWIGYFNTTGIRAIDYWLGDPITNPVDDDKLFTEKVYRLPNCRFCYQPPEYAPDVTPTPAIKNRHITFGSFNNIHKLSPEVIKLWARVLNEVPDSKFIYKSNISDEETCRAILAMFQANGIDCDRIELRNKSPHQEMLKEYGDIDISLDTFPFNGGMTTCELLWMGVPLVTLAGNTPIARQGKAYLYAIGYPEWVAKTDDEFVSIALRLASDITKLNEIRKGLRGKFRSSPVLNSDQFTRNLEDAYRTMWQTWCAGESKQLPVSSDTMRHFSTDELLGAGISNLKDGAYERAIGLFRRVIKRDPYNEYAQNNLGIAYKKLGFIDDAIRAFRKAVRNAPDNSQVYINCGMALKSCGRFHEARIILHKACIISPDDCAALNSLGEVCLQLGYLHEARLSLEHALTIEPNNVDSLGHLAIVNGLYGDIPAALTRLRVAISHDPGNSSLASALMGLSMYHPETTQAELYQLGRMFEQALKSASCNFSIASRPVVEKNGPLRIGFLSPDFRAHPVGVLLKPFFTHRNRSRFSLFCYNTSGGVPDYLNQWYRSVSDGWHDICGWPDDDVIATIKNDEIDILIDLTGHTDAKQRGLSVFARRAAPVQATWIGYGHTTGLAEMDYIIADPDFIRPEDKKWFSEQPVYLPHNRFCFMPPDNSPEVVDSPFFDNEYITFGSFNNLQKISDEVIETWVEILRRVPKSRLILKFKSLNDPDVRRYTRQRFERYGLARKRLELRPESNLYLMLAEYGDIDISLDPFPFTGGMTSLYSLWMGVPIVTLAGDLPISRQTKSFLYQVGLNGLVANSIVEYCEYAVQLTRDKEQLSTIREGLRQRMYESPLCDAKQYAANVECVFHEMLDISNSGG